MTRQIGRRLARAEAAAAYPRRDAGHQLDEAESHPQRAPEAAGGLRGRGDGGARRAGAGRAGGRSGAGQGVGGCGASGRRERAPRWTPCRRCCSWTTWRRCAARRRPSSGVCGRGSSRRRRCRGSTSGPAGARRRCSSGSGRAASAVLCAGGRGGRGERGRGPRRPGDEPAEGRRVARGRARGGGSGVHLPGLLAGGGGVLAGAAGRDGAQGGAAAGLGALRDLRSGSGVLMRAVEKGGAGTVGQGMAPGDGGAWRNGESKAT